jgi:phosphatidylethanolamine-binding protein (PEBP) family uncharacterized protein
MQQPHKAIASVMLLGALLLAGCGSGSSTVKEPTILTVKSAAIDGAEKAIPARYTCDGGNVSPPLEWGAVPPGTHSLVLFVLGFTPVPGASNYSVSVEWAVGGLNPELHKLAAGQLPAGAYEGLTSDKKRQYSLCPKKGALQHYQFEMYGLPAGAVLSPEFAGLPILSKLATNTSAHPSIATARGGLVFTYKRV